MDVVFDASNLTDKHLMVAADCAEVCPNFWLGLFGDEFFSSGGAENNVLVVFGVCMGQGSPLPIWHLLYINIQMARRFLYRDYGA